MGPRPNGRGKAAPVRVRARTCRVNGAAAKRPRKAEPTAAPLDPGALRQWGRGQTAAESGEQAGGRRESDASMGPRPNGRGKIPPRTNMPRPADARQWGRGQTAAESSNMERIFHSPKARQWGRGQTAAERLRSRRGRCLHTQRQWGRGQTAAESLLFFELPACRYICVNGAAAKRPRKDRGCPAARDFPDASMGPRPNGRGKAARLTHSPPSLTSVNGAAAKRPRKVAPIVKQKNMFDTSVNGAAAKRPRKARRHAVFTCRRQRQWGRGQTAAESATRRPFPGMLAGVNGAAAKRPRKVHRGLWA